MNAADARANLYGNPSLVPLVAGSSGGSVGQEGTLSVAQSGAGGGAIQLVAGSTIRLLPEGTISASGAPGSSVGGRGAGGGSGGAILLEAPNVVVVGSLTANGGDGGLEVNGNVARGASETNPARNGASGSLQQGGGGGLGRIRINTSGASANIGASSGISPLTADGCFSQGVLNGFQ